MSTQLEFTVDGQRLSRSNRWELVANQTENYVIAHFIFLSDDWVPEETTVVFESPNHDVYTAQLDENGYCDVPNEVIADYGYLTVSLFYSVIETRMIHGESKEYVVYRVTTNPVNVYTFETVTTLLGGDG